MSICVICEENGRDLKDDLNYMKGFCNEIVVASCGSSDTEADVLAGMNASVTILGGSANSAESATQAVFEVRGKWILMLRPGDRISPQNVRQIEKLCLENDAEAFRFICQAALDENSLAGYEWLSNQGKFCTTTVLESGYVPLIETRLFKKSVFKKVLVCRNHVFQLELDPKARVRTCGDIRITFPSGRKALKGEPCDEEKWEQDKQIFLGESNREPETTHRFELIGPGNIGYSLISENDLPSLEAGLEMGFGHIDILKWALNNLNKKGAYDRVIEFSEKIRRRLSDHSEIWHLKGIAHFYKLDLVNARKCMQKAHEMNPLDQNILSDLTRAHIVSGNHVEAEAMLEKVKILYGLTAENEYIYESIRQNRGLRAEISLLMICRDEEAYLPRALKSIRGLVDEIVAVDTGSEDGTIPILRKNGAKIVRHPWGDDFAEAKNVGLLHVSKDYVFCLDADEYLDAEERLSFLVLKSLLPVTEKRGVVFEIHTLNDAFDMHAKVPPIRINRRTALFPNHPDIRFSGRVLESVDASLEALDTPMIFAESILIKHQHSNRIQRKRRQVRAMTESLGLLSPGKLFTGIQFWLDLDDNLRALQWFEKAIAEADGNIRYLNSICENFDRLQEKGCLDKSARLFTRLVSKYGASYRIMTLCADYLFSLKEYDACIKLLNRLIQWEYHGFSDRPEPADILNNRRNYAMSCLEKDDFGGCDKALTLMLNGDEINETARAIAFYREIRKKDIDNAIAILDQWIRDRNIPLADTINNFNDLLQVIMKFSDILSNFGYIDAGNIMIRSAHYLGSTFALTE